MHFMLSKLYTIDKCSLLWLEMEASRIFAIFEDILTILRRVFINFEYYEMLPNIAAISIIADFF